MHEMIRQRIGRLRRPGIDDKIFCRQRSQLRAHSTHQPQSEIDVTESRSGGNKPAGFHNHVRFIQQHLRIPLPKERRQPPCCSCVMMIEQSGLGHHERSDAGGGHRCASPSPLSKRGARILDVRPRKRALQGTGILNPIAGTTTQSGARQPFTSTGTEKPCEVLTALRTPTIRTSKRGTASPDISISSLAV